MFDKTADMTLHDRLSRTARLALPICLWVCLSAVLLLCAGPPAAAQPLPPYPATRQGEQVDTYHGQRVADPYRWLEDETAADTAAWVAAENKVTEAYFERITFRAALKARLTQLFDYPRYTAPERRGNSFYYRANSGLQNQSVVLRQQGLEGAPETVLDPNTLSADGTTRLVTFSLQPAGKYAVLALSRGGSDWQQLRVMDLATKALLDDRVEWVKVSGIAWSGDGFFYSRYPAPADGRELTGRNENHQVYFHRLGTAQAADERAYEDSVHAQRFHTVETFEGGRYAVLSLSERGQGRRGNALFVRELGRELQGSDKTFKPVVAEIGDDSFDVVDEVGGRLVVRTDHGAPNGRVVLIDPQRPAEANWQTLVAERAEPIRGVSTAGGRLFVATLKDVSSRVYVHRLDGTLEREITLPGLGSASGFEGRADDSFVFYTFTSFNVPPTIYRYDIATGRSSVFRAPQLPGFDAAAFETKQVFFSSRDGTRVPMFLVHRKGLVLDGSNPTLLYGYGGFNISLVPTFSASRVALLEQGVVFAVANLRGGGEYGETWHRAGTRLQKQNVFDDFIAAAEWLVKARYTSPQKLAMEGGSNGGLLVGAVANQRPDLFAVALPAVGVMDMLRFQKFTIGWNWISDYGSSDNADEFKALFAYSPLHNIRAGVRYPATLITTADHDDRVVPAHSFKYAATLQAKAARTNPVLIRIDTRSGHGASNTTKQIESTADVYAFLLYQLGVVPKVLP
jgi:prolyl oligopeptidase